VLLIAHRGASAVAPESTRAAILEAARQGAEAIELDVQMTRDQRLVIFHDERLERTTNGTGRLSAARFSLLAKLDAGSWFHPRFSGERVLLVSQAMALIPRRMDVILELKSSSRRRSLVGRLWRLLQRQRVVERVIVSSFDARLLRLLRREGLRLALVSREDPRRAVREAVRLGCAAWHPRHVGLTRELIETAHARGMQVHTWTVETSARARQLASWGVDGIFTNHPARFSRSHPVTQSPSHERS
jgi:glycerophosphoryl diester phosphodiesterase